MRIGLTAFLLVLSNVFMTFAWYSHLKHLAKKPWIVAALVSWGSGRARPGGLSTTRWARRKGPMLPPRHGLWPVLSQGHVFLAGGGAVAGSSHSRVIEAVTRQ